MNRPVALVAMAHLSPGPDGRVPGFDPVAAGLPRKNLKTMTRAVQLGVATVARALAEHAAWSDVPPARRGLFVGASPQSGDPEDLAPALVAMAGERGVTAFAERAVPLIPPLWLVKGLSNNVLGYASAAHDLQGDNGNWCDGRLGGAVAIANAIRSVAEGRVDLAVAGGADALHGAEAVLGRACAEGAAFFVFVAGEGAGVAEAGVPDESGVVASVGELGAAAIPLALAEAWARGERVAEAGGIRLTRA
jgi:hypothetical protein